MRVPVAAPVAVLVAAVTAATLLGGGATPESVATRASAPASSSTPRVSSLSSSSSSVAPSGKPWGEQDTSLAAARRIACGPKPYGTNSGLALELAHETGPPNPQPPAAPRTWTATPRPPPVPGQLGLEDLTLVPPPADTKPAACVEFALDALRKQADGVGSAQPAKVRLTILSAPTPAIINADGSETPVFTSVLAWVFYFDDLPPLCPGGAPAGSIPQCDPAKLGRQARSSVSTPRPPSR